MSRFLDRCALRATYRYFGNFDLLDLWAQEEKLRFTWIVVMAIILTIVVLPFGCWLGARGYDFILEFDQRTGMVKQHIALNQVRIGPNGMVVVVVEEEEVRRQTTQRRPTTINWRKEGF
jgi:hypothetical protein